VEEKNLLELVPQRISQWETRENNRIDILVPKLRGKWLGKWLLPKMKKPHYKVRLDDIGSFVWQQCDGEKTIRQIALCLRENFGEKAEPVFERVCIFFKKLEKGCFINYINL